MMLAGTTALSPFSFERLSPCTPTTKKSSTSLRESAYWLTKVSLITKGMLSFRNTEEHS